MPSCCIPACPLLNSAIKQKKNPVNINEVRKHVPIFDSDSRKLLPVPDIRELKKNRENYLSVYSFLLCSISGKAEKQVGQGLLNNAALRAFLLEPVMETDWSFYPKPLEYCLQDNAETRRQKAASLFSRVPLSQQLAFMRVFKEEFSELGECLAGQDYAGKKTEQQTHLLAHAAGALSIIFERMREDLGLPESLELAERQLRACQ